MIQQISLVPDNLWVDAIGRASRTASALDVILVD
jgi:hypothetical protein